MPKTWFYNHRLTLSHPVIRANIFFNTFLLTAILGLSACEPNTFQEGERLYKAQCANCHMDDGIGLSALIPPIAGSDYLPANRDILPCIIRYGLKDTIVVNGKTYAEIMPGVAKLTDVQITNLLNFINNSWGNQNGLYRLEEVQATLEECRLQVQRGER
jgi:mono/diheme cytochrome c family protein